MSSVLAEQKLMDIRSEICFAPPPRQVQFTQGHTLSCQYQLACELPGQPRLLALTYSKGDELAHADFDHWQHIKQSLRFA
ncbi:DcrB/PsbP domain-containing protein [Pseudomonas tolaasii]|uniref:hypothetical protein n=1 Tax=Pseudomonas tolaasii TaxID=29442 RepID=UPI0002F70F45|nr:hypothetical protein [Pseudomonas tolaasii]